MDKVYFTGIGIISALGMGKEENKKKFLNNESGISEFTFSEGKIEGKAALIKDFNCEDYFEHRKIRRMERYSRLMMVSSKFAVEDAKISDSSGEEYGSVFATYWGPLNITEDYFRTLIQKGPLQTSPLQFPSLVTNASLGRVAMEYHLKSASSYLVGACPIEYSYELIMNHDIEGVITGACDEIYSTNYESLFKSGYLDDGKGGQISLGEGAIVFCMESATHARKRGANVYGSLYAINSMFAPALIDPIDSIEAERRWIENIDDVMNQACITAQDIGCIVSAADSNSQVDEIEAKALKHVFGDRLQALKIVRPKALFGEIFGVGSAIAAFSALSMLSEDSMNSKENPVGSTSSNSCRYTLCNSFIPGSNITNMIIGKE